MSELMLSLGKAIRKAREKKGLSANQIAELLRMKGHAYRRYERGEVPMKATTLIEIADALDVSLDELVGKQKHKDDSKIIHQKISAEKGQRIIFTVE